MHRIPSANCLTNNPAQTWRAAACLAAASRCPLSAALGHTTQGGAYQHGGWAGCCLAGVETRFYPAADRALPAINRNGPVPAARTCRAGTKIRGRKPPVNSVWRDTFIQVRVQAGRLYLRPLA